MNIRFYNNTALKFIRKQQAKQQQRIMAAIKRLPEGDIKLLKGKDNIYRLRVGDYRVTFSIDHVQEEIIIRTADNRGDIYK